ncbi:MAG: double-strand break repair helicase AddA [Pseudomonadota bacterium]
MNALHDATIAQVKAANPEDSTWLSANAGSGKTRVLTDRVARLLLQGVLPQSVLCLTYTKAAASEMQNRLFSRLGAWAMMDDGPLAEALNALGVAQCDPETLAEARRLFARAIETPGGLKIQTIHSFCATILRRFPLEAQVPPGFKEMDERAAEQLRQDVLDDLADKDPGLFQDCATHVSDQTLLGLTDAINNEREALKGEPNWVATAQRFGVPQGYNEADIEARVFQGDEAEIIAGLIPLLSASSPQDVKAADKLSQLGILDISSLPRLEDIFLTGKDTKTPYAAKLDSFPTKPVREANPDLCARLNDFMARVEDARTDRISLKAARRTHALHQFAAAFLPMYQARKALTGQLDFDDLILKTRDLLVRPGLAEWVLYKLDGGISHILVDEAQDTSPEQWQVVRALTEEFTSGGAPDTGRTIFVVGDKKQSIYSFQGADPRGFDKMREEFAERLKAIDCRLEQSQLQYSFRSSTAVLQLVDHVFAGNPPGVGSVGHLAFKHEMPGRVDLWPLVEETPTPDDSPWDAPLDMVSEEHHNKRLARAVAAEITRIKQEEVLWSADGQTPRSIGDGDFLILVQRRSVLFHDIIRACKDAGLAIAGADRLRLGGELAVKDLVATLRFLATPEDDLSLAAALRSPLFGWSEDALFRMAHPRKGYLWEALRNEELSPARQVLSALLDEADFLRPYDLLMRLLLQHSGRRKLVARLGEEAEDGIDALLSQALAYEQQEPPSLTGFLVWMDSGEVDIKRQADSSGGKVRVMTVHGAKGLEAPIVFLPDTGLRRDPVPNDLLPDGAGGILWKTTTDEAPELVQSAIAESKEREAEERQRLLYVAMTRAEQWLIVCAAGKPPGPTDWFRMVEAGMARAGGLAHPFAVGEGQRFEPIPWPTATATPDARPVASTVNLPSWAFDAVPKPERPVAPISPSDLGGAKALAQEWDGKRTTEDAMALGSAIHLLLEHLPGEPPTRWPQLAKALVADWAEPALAQAKQVLEHPTLSQLFDQDTLFSHGTLAEVPLTARLPGTDRVIQGTVDLLLVGADRVTAIDFKSNAVVPDTPQTVPDGLLRQLGAYTVALEQIYPGRTVETAILWTAEPSLMPLPHGLVTEALQKAPLP